MIKYLEKRKLIEEEREKKSEKSKTIQRKDTKAGVLLTIEIEENPPQKLCLDIFNKDAFVEFLDQEYSNLNSILSEAKSKDETIPMFE